MEGRRAGREHVGCRVVGGVPSHCVCVLEFVPPLGDFLQGVVSRLSLSCRIGAWGHHLGVYLDGAVRTYASRIFRLAVLGLEGEDPVCGCRGRLVIK